ncbi:nascent polypeptide-associated complex subunit alpha isoform X2 [Colossoma macropomum]|uniref:nascent polypeptide-associated complex subunit alpha isoform X2 n=1 Tax=Colossoma macropomum TaxID=42526 RepID=UPI00186422ED|nr:nascent polypeptide-associated complex subunit alpha isoform X2 [Colossoma macropomum]
MPGEATETVPVTEQEMQQPQVETAPGVVSAPASSEAAAPEITKPTPVQSAVPEASTVTLETQNNAETVAHSAEEAIPTKAEIAQSNGEVVRLVTEEQAVAQAATALDKFASASEDSKEPAGLVQEAVVQGQADIVEDLKETLVGPAAQEPEEVATEEQAVITETDPVQRPAAEEPVLEGDAVDGLPVFQENITEPQGVGALPDDLKSMSLEATIEHAKESSSEAANALEIKPLDRAVDPAVQNEVVAEKEVIALSEAVQGKVQANRAGPSRSSQHLSGGSICVKSDPLLVLSEQKFFILCTCRCTLNYHLSGVESS